MKPLAAALALALSLPSGAQQPASFPDAAASPPPLPFRYVGRVVQKGRAEVLLMRGAMLYSIGEGDEIDGEYRVERITGASIRFVYLPGRIAQSLDLTR